MITSALDGDRCRCGRALADGRAERYGAAVAEGTATWLLVHCSCRRITPIYLTLDLAPVGATDRLAILAAPEIREAA